MNLLQYTILISFLLHVRGILDAQSGVVSNGTSPSYDLVYWREENDLFLYCDTIEPNISKKTIFRVNETEPIYFGSAKYFDFFSNEMLIALSVLPELNLGLVKFTLLPKYEGTYFCGDPITNVWSEGVGPLVANPVFVDENKNLDLQIIGSLNGQNVTIPCPVPQGMLTEFYYTLWLFYDGKNFEILNITNKFIVSNGDYNTLTILNLQDNDYTHYGCLVVVQDPTTNLSTMGYVFTHTLLINKFNWKYYLYHGFVYTGWYLVLAITFFSFCICQWCVRFCVVCVPRIFDKSPAVKFGPKGSNFATYSMESEVSQFGTEYIDGLSLDKDQCVGKGAFGTVYRGTYKGQICAAKMLIHHARFHVTRVKEKFASKAVPHQSVCNECKFLEEFSHRNIVQHITTLVQPTSNLPILVIEYMDCNLKSYLQRCQPKILPVFFQISIFLDISKGLTYLHSKGIIHCDLCDNNVLLNLNQSTPTAKISDFSLSTLLPHDLINSTLSTLEQRKTYFPPEITINFTNYTKSTDVYALGVIGLQIALCEIKIKSCEESIVKLPTNNLLRSTILACLHENDRPSSEEVVQRIILLEQ